MSTTSTAPHIPFLSPLAIHSLLARLDPGEGEACQVPGCVHGVDPAAAHAHAEGRALAA